jgi:hypothetical protein
MLWTAPPPARECHEGGVLLRPLRLEGANHADDHNFRKLIADRVAKRNGAWHMTRHKGDENAAPENWSGASNSDYVVIRRPCGNLCRDNGKGGCGDTRYFGEPGLPVSGERRVSRTASIELARARRLNGRPRLL